MSWTHLEDTKPKARKPYQCYLCGRPIAKGEVYIKRVGIGDGGYDTSRMHVACEALTRDWDESDWESCDTATFREEVLGERNGDPIESEDEEESP